MKVCQLNMAAVRLLRRKLLISDVRSCWGDKITLILILYPVAEVINIGIIKVTYWEH